MYCTQILGWLPPLIFSALVQANVDQKYGILSLQAFFVVAIGFVSMIHWSSALEQVHGPEFVDNVINDKAKQGCDLETEIHPVTPVDEADAPSKTR